MAEARRARSEVTTDLTGARVLIVEARFYDDIADALLAGAIRTLDAAGATHERITVPGALEIPAAVAMGWGDGRRYDAVVALGCVIRGDTIHFEIVSTESARGLLDISVAREIPLGNGILTVNEESQAWARARIEEGDKGGDAARAALAMLRHKRRFNGNSSAPAKRATATRAAASKTKASKTKASKTKRANVKRR